MKTKGKIREEVLREGSLELGCNKCYQDRHLTQPYNCSCECHKKQYIGIAIQKTVKEIFERLDKICISTPNDEGEMDEIAKKYKSKYFRMMPLNKLKKIKKEFLDNR